MTEKTLCKSCKRNHPLNGHQFCLEYWHALMSLTFKEIKHRKSNNAFPFNINPTTILAGMAMLPMMNAFMRMSRKRTKKKRLGRFRREKKSKSINI